MSWHANTKRKKLQFETWTVRLVIPDANPHPWRLHIRRRNQTKYKQFSIPLEYNYSYVWNKFIYEMVPKSSHSIDISLTQIIMAQSFYICRWSGYEVRTNIVSTWSKMPQTWPKKRTLNRHMLYTILIQSSKLHSSSWSGRNARPNMVPT